MKTWISESKKLDQGRGFFFDSARIALGVTAILTPTLAPAQGVFQRAESALERLKDNIKGDLKDLSEDVKGEAAYLLGMEGYLYGFPLVIMDLTRQVETANPKGRRIRCSHQPGRAGARLHPLELRKCGAGQF